MFKAANEINEELTKNKEGFLLDFMNGAYSLFDKQSVLYWEEKGYYDYENETFDKNVMNRDFYFLDSLIKKHTKDKNFITYFRKLETNLPMLYTGV